MRRQRRLHRGNRECDGSADVIQRDRILTTQLIGRGALCKPLEDELYSKAVPRNTGLPNMTSGSRSI